jgi:hypothetical protein
MIFCRPIHPAIVGNKPEPHAPVVETLKNVIFHASTATIFRSCIGDGVVVNLMIFLLETVLILVKVDF